MIVSPTAFWIGVALFAAIATWEFLGVAGVIPYTITYFIRSVTPLWARWMILGWLCYHFGLAK